MPNPLAPSIATRAYSPRDTSAKVAKCRPEADETTEACLARLCADMQVYLMQNVDKHMYPTRLLKAPKGGIWAKMCFTMEEVVIRYCLERGNGNLIIAARMFGADRNTFRKRLDRHGIHQRDFKRGL